VFRKIHKLSGGLSHDPPVPNYAKAAPELRNILISAGRNASAEQRLQREQRVRSAASEFVAGRTGFVEPDPAWDRRVMDLLEGARLADMDDWDEDVVTREGGCGGHEVRTWLAAFAAQRAVGRYTVDLSHYEIVRPWMTGMAIMRAETAIEEKK
jgi:2,3-dihydroxyphenylpropionate 1,2-dioxygenase